MVADCRLFLLATLLLLSLSLPESAASAPKPHARMMRIESPFFEVIAPCERDDCIQMIRFLEWIRLVFEKNFQLAAPARKTVVYFCPSEKSWERMSLISHSNGFFIDLPSRGHIVIRNLKDWQMAALHEFAHLWMRQKMKRHVAWLDEGIACYFEGFRSEKGKVETGLPVYGRVCALKARSWLSAETIFTASHSTEIKGDSERALFYAQSWLMVHMLRLSPEFRAGFPEFFQSVAEGMEAGIALQKVYGIPPGDLIRKARQWWALPVWPTEPLDPPDRMQFRITLSPAEAETVELAEATLSAARLPESERSPVYARMAERLGESCASHLPLGDLAFNLGLLDSAAKHYQAAVRCGTPAAEIGRGIALAAAEEQELSAERIREIEAVTGDRSVRADLAAGRLRRDDFEGVLRATEDLSGMSRDAVFRASRMRAIALIHLERFDEAAKLASRLAASATDDFERQSAKLLFEDIESRSRAKAAAAVPAHEVYLRQLWRADGVVVRVDCMETWARLNVKTNDGQDLSLRIADPGEVVTGDGEGEKIDLQCGPQQLPAVIGYVPEQDETSGTQGRVKYLRLRR
jgi:tetratricopeptide (TPR) repeat protein